jgi:phage terminase large subunit-like protein
VDFNEALVKSWEVLNFSGVPYEERPPIRNFLEYGSLLCMATRALTPRARESLPWLSEWALTWRRLCDDFDAIVAADPMVLYEPTSQAALDFHSSLAYIRYFRAGNRTGKTQAGYAEHYLITTGQHRWRNFGTPPHATALIAGLPFAQYTPNTFDRKMVLGETDNPISPLFPVGGKWFYHYDERKHVLTVACPECAGAGKAGSCPHPKSTISLFSSELGYEVLQGAVYTFVHFDEDTPSEFFEEATQRTKTAKYGCMAITGTPLHGPLAWEQTKVANRITNGNNLTDPENPNSSPYASLHVVSQFDAGLVPHDRVRRDMAGMDKFAIRARIYGEPMAIANNPVFDREALQEMVDKVVSRPLRGIVRPKTIDGFTPKLDQITPRTELEFVQSGSGNLRVWKAPTPGEIYVAGVDTAAGLTNGDASCCTIARCFVQGGGLALEIVAQWHGWANPSNYADAIHPILAWYNGALTAVELTGGLGRAVVMRLKNDNHYWAMYRETIDPAMIELRPEERVGVETSATSKPFMVAALQKFLQDRMMLVPCADTITELNAFEQEIKSRNNTALMNPRYRGAKNHPDDRVMSLAIIASVAVSYAPLLFQVKYSTEKKVEHKVSADMEKLYREEAAARMDSTIDSGMV